MGSLVGATLGHLIEWVESLQGSNLVLHLPADSSSDPIEQLADALTPADMGFERHLLLKSIQEALFDFVGIGTHLSTAEITARLKRALENDTDGAAFILRFLSLHLFNHVWFYTCELFRLRAPSPEAFEREAQEVGRICERSVAAAFEHIETLDTGNLQKLLGDIERELRGAFAL